MESLSFEYLARYWSARDIGVNIIVFANVLGALLLGFLIGYERSYRGRAAGMRTYGLVCMASCAITVIVGFPGYWFGGTEGSALQVAVNPMPAIAGIVTGVGFLGAGVIMKEGLNISGLTTAASIWSSSVIGILVGLNFYFAAILVSVLSAALMMWVSKLEQWLPSHPAVALMLRFRPGFAPQESAVAGFAREQGYSLAGGSLQIHLVEGRQEWHFVIVATGNDQPVWRIAERLGSLEGVEGFRVSYARN